MDNKSKAITTRAWTGIVCARKIGTCRGCVCVSEVFFNGLLNCQNYISGWRKWKNEIHARTLGGMTLTEKIRSSKTHPSRYYFVHHKFHMFCPEVRPVQEGLQV